MTENCLVLVVDVVDEGLYDTKKGLFIEFFFQIWNHLLHLELDSIFLLYTLPALVPPDLNFMFDGLQVLQVYA